MDMTTSECQLCAERHERDHTNPKFFATTTLTSWPMKLTIIYPATLPFTCAQDPKNTLKVVTSRTSKLRYCLYSVAERYVQIWSALRTY